MNKLGSKLGWRMVLAGGLVALGLSLPAFAAGRDGRGNGRGHGDGGGRGHSVGPRQSGGQSYRGGQSHRGAQSYRGGQSHRGGQSYRGGQSNRGNQSWRGPSRPGGSWRQQGGRVQGGGGRVDADRNWRRSSPGQTREYRHDGRGYRGSDRGYRGPDSNRESWRRHDGRPDRSDHRRPEYRRPDYRRDGGRSWTPRHDGRNWSPRHDGRRWSGRSGSRYEYRHRSGSYVPRHRYYRRHYGSGFGRLYFWWPSFSYGYYPFGYYPFGSYGAYGVYGNYYAIPDCGYLELDIQPEEAEVYLDGEWMGPAYEFNSYSRYLQIAPGYHELEIVLEGYGSYQVPLEIRRGQTIRVSRALVPVGGGPARFEGEFEGDDCGECYPQ